MKKTAFLFLVSVIFFWGVNAAEVTGYLSFDFLKGQKQSGAENGVFRNSEAGFSFSGMVSQKYGYQIELSLSAGDNINIEQAWLGWSPSKSFSFKLGLYPVPFGNYNQINRPFLTPLIHAPLNIAHLFPHRWKDIGALMEGNISGFRYSFYVGNGLAEGASLSDGQQFGDNNGDKGWGGKLSLDVGSGVDVSYSRFWGKYDNEGSRNILLQALDVVWFADTVEVLYEHVWADMEHPEAYEDGEGNGYFVQVILNFSKLRTFVCYQSLDYKDVYHGEGFVPDLSPGKGISMEKSRWAAGLVFIPTPGVLIKMEYDWNREKDNEIDNNLFSIQVALNF